MTSEEKLKHFEDSVIGRANELSREMLKEYQESLDKEEEAYQALLSLRAPGESLRQFHEKSLRQLARRRRQREGDYYALFLAQLEHAAQAKGVEVFQIYGDRELLELAGLAAD